MMRIGIAADHGRFELKGILIEVLKSSGYEIQNFGADQYDGNDDYPGLWSEDETGGC